MCWVIRESEDKHTHLHTHSLWARNVLTFQHAKIFTGCVVVCVSWQRDEGCVCSVNDYKYVGVVLCYINCTLRIIRFNSRVSRLLFILNLVIIISLRLCFCIRFLPSASSYNSNTTSSTQPNWRSTIPKNLPWAKKTNTEEWTEQLRVWTKFE